MLGFSACCKVQDGTSDRKVTKSQQPRLALSADSHKMLRGLESLGFRPKHVPWFLSSPFIIRVPFFLLFGFSKGSPTIKRAKGYHSGT